MSQSTPGDDANQCTASTVIPVSILANPLITISGNKLICIGQPLSLIANGAITYTWNNGSLGTSINISPTTNTFYTVTGTSANFCSATATVNISLATCKGVKENITSNGLHIFPNPTTGNIYIELSLKSELILFDATGKFLNTTIAEPGTQTLLLQEYAVGIYLLKVVNNQGTSVHKIIRVD